MGLVPPCAGWCFHSFRNEENARPVILDREQHRFSRMTEVSASRRGKDIMLSLHIVLIEEKLYSM